MTNKKNIQIFIFLWLFYRNITILNLLYKINSYFQAKLQIKVIFFNKY